MAAWLEKFVDLDLKSLEYFYYQRILECGTSDFHDSFFYKGTVYSVIKNRHSNNSYIPLHENIPRDFLTQKSIIRKCRYPIITTFLENFSVVLNSPLVRANADDLDKFHGRCEIDSESTAPITPILSHPCSSILDHHSTSQDIAHAYLQSIRIRGREKTHELFYAFGKEFSILRLDIKQQPVSKDKIYNKVSIINESMGGLDDAVRDVVIKNNCILIEKIEAAIFGLQNDKLVAQAQSVWEALQSQIARFEKTHIRDSASNTDTKTKPNDKLVTKAQSVQETENSFISTTEMMSASFCLSNTNTQAKSSDEPNKDKPNEESQSLLESFSLHSQTSEDECEYFGMDGDSTADVEELSVPIVASAAVGANSLKNLPHIIGTNEFLSQVKSNSQPFLISFKR